jgi:hypothetical protein
VRILKVFAVLLLGSPAWASYQYYLTDNLTSIDPNKWTQNGSVSATASGLTSPATYGGSLISRSAVPDGTSDYEVRMKLSVTASTTWWSSQVLYARATPDANAVTGTGTYYAFSAGWLAGSSDAVPLGTFSLYKRVGGVTTMLASFVHTLSDGTYLRMVVRQNTVMIAVDSVHFATFTDSDIPAGQPGVGASLGGAVTEVRLGPADRVAPPAIDAVQPVGVSVFPNRVDLQWPTASDDANGIGLSGYLISRDGISLANVPDPQFSDETVAPGNTYTYTISLYDQHGNSSPPATKTVTVPADAAPDQRRTGVRSTGSYWGAAGEQIDLASGNLNFTIPLFTAKGRAGQGATFALSYNSQIWRQDAGGTWRLGDDVGYGLGWRLMAGCLAPVWLGTAQIHHFVFTDMSGTEYRLDQPNGGVWTSREGTYISYDSNAGRLYFTDGMVWEMGAQSAGMEPDAGTLYPTRVKDTNGYKLS